MDCGKRILMSGLVLIFAVAGCGRKAQEKTAPLPASTGAAKEQQGIYIESTSPAGIVKSEAGGAKVTVQLPMVEPEKNVELQEGEILVADFEGWPNNLGGEMGVYGSLEPNWDEIVEIPYSWTYEPVVPGYDPANVHGGRQSYRLVNGLGTKPEETWGSFSLDLGPVTDLTVIPKKVESLDVSGYQYLTFWAKGEKGGEKMQLLVRDAHALNYMPQIKYTLPDLTTEWTKVVVPLEELKGKVDLARLDNIGIAFGRDVGNIKGEIAYLDDFVFTNKP